MRVYIIVAVFVLTDVVTGLLKAWYLGVINSTVLRKGLFNKLGEFIAVALSALLEYTVGYIHIEVDVPLVTATSAYIVIMELVSIIENLCVISPKMYKFFSPFLGKLKGDDNTDGSENWN